MAEINLTDENLDEFLQKATKPVLVDFWGKWCGPCAMLAPVLEKIVESYKDKLIFVKAELEDVPNTAQKLGVDRVPMVVLFKEGNPVGGFIGVQPEPVIREMLDKMLQDNFVLESAIQEYQDYADQNGIKLNPDRSVVERVVSGLLDNEKKHGARYCPCQRMIKCPCPTHKEDIAKNGHCICSLFVK